MGEGAVARLRAMAPTISVGITAGNLLALGEDLAALGSAGVQLLHVDVMDGCFCPMMTVGPPVIKALQATPMLIDVHLMIAEPLSKLESYVTAGADAVTVHVESTVHPHRALQAIGAMTNARDPERGIVRGAALNPGTPLEALAPLMDEVDLVMLLAVNPGWGGQKFIAATEDRLACAREMIAGTGRDVLLAVDGGIKRDNIAEVATMGPDIIVTGSAVLDGKAPAENARFMLDAVRNANI